MATGFLGRLFNPQGTGQPVNGTQTPPVPGDRGKDLNNPGANPAAVPPNGQAQPTAPISPLDEFKDLWKTAAPDGKTPVDPLTQPLLQNDPAKFAEAAGKLNFTTRIPPEMITKALAGDPKAFADAINAAAQEAFMAASTLSTQMVEGASQTNNKRFESVLDGKFKDFLVRNERSENPVLQHPSAAPMLDLAKRQLTAQHPDKTASEIHQMAERYLVDFSESLVAQKSKAATAERNSGPDPFDFSNYGT